MSFLYPALPVLFIVILQLKPTSPEKYVMAISICVCISRSWSTGFRYFETQEEEE